jgi:hypothetical protein
VVVVNNAAGATSAMMADEASSAAVKIPLLPPPPRPPLMARKSLHLWFKNPYLNGFKKNFILQTLLPLWCENSFLLLLKHTPHQNFTKDLAPPPHLPLPPPPPP